MQRGSLRIAARPLAQPPPANPGTTRPPPAPGSWESQLRSARPMHATPTAGLHLELARRQVAETCAEPPPAATDNREGGIRSRPIAQHYQGRPPLPQSCP